MFRQKEKARFGAARFGVRRILRKCGKHVVCKLLAEVESATHGTVPPQYKAKTSAGCGTVPLRQAQEVREQYRKKKFEEEQKAPRPNPNKNFGSSAKLVSD